jgi:uncharacterized membrane protein
MNRSTGVDDSWTSFLWILLPLVIVFVWWIVGSYFEARAFNRVTGKDVSIFDAMFIELRVQEPMQYKEECKQNGGE